MKSRWMLEWDLFDIIEIQRKALNFDVLLPRQWERVSFRFVSCFCDLFICPYFHILAFLFLYFGIFFSFLGVSCVVVPWWTKNINITWWNPFSVCHIDLLIFFFDTLHSVDNNKQSCFSHLCLCCYDGYKSWKSHMCVYEKNKNKHSLIFFVHFSSIVSKIFPLFKPSSSSSGWWWVNI